MTAVAIVTEFEANDTNASITATLVTLAPATGDFVFSWKVGSKIRVAKITP